MQLKAIVFFPSQSAILRVEYEKMLHSCSPAKIWVFFVLVITKFSIIILILSLVKIVSNQKLRDPILDQIHLFCKYSNLILEKP